MNVERPRLAHEWARRSFGDVALDRVERAARLVEEAIEVAQCEGLEPEFIRRILKRAYARPPGELAQEIGGVGLTLEVLAHNAELVAEDCTEAEWQRVDALPLDWWEKKHAEKVRAGTADVSWLDPGRCSSCKFCSMDMEMDPFCVHPKVREKKPYGLLLRHAVKDFCGPGLTLREAKETPPA